MFYDILKRFKIIIQGNRNSDEPPEKKAKQSEMVMEGKEFENDIYSATNYHVSMSNEELSVAENDVKDGLVKYDLETLFSKTRSFQRQEKNLLLPVHEQIEKFPYLTYESRISNHKFY